jgi:ABC-2 type transport system permease protein
MLRSVFGKTLWGQRQGIVAWSIGLGAVGVLYAAFYPSMANPDMQAAMDAFPPEMLDALGFTDITSPEGYLGGTTYGLLGPVLSIIYATTLGSRAIAGEEESGRLELLLAHPVERWQVVLQRSAAMLVALVIAGAVLLLAMIAAAGPAQYDSIPTANLAAATVQLVLLAWLFGSLALAVGALSGSRGLAIGMVALVGVATYFANTLGPSVDALAWSRDVSPFHYYSGGAPLREGWPALDAAVLAASSLLLTAVAMLGLERRDVGV